VSSRRLGGEGDGVEVLIALPDSPDDAGDLVGDGGGCLVVTAGGVSRESPGVKSIGRLVSLGGVEYGRSPLRRHRTGVTSGCTRL
jgi:hypothetical protein